MTITTDELRSALDEACAAARVASESYYVNRLNSRDQLPCGFAWITISGIRKGSKLDHVLNCYGITKSDYERAHVFWNPGGLPLQNVDAKAAGARAAADVLKRAGLSASAGERLD
jgi:hypothetical protein